MTESLAAKLGPTWHEGMVRPGGVRPLGYPYRLTDRTLAIERKIRPAALAVDAGWWGEYFHEFGDSSLCQYDAWIGLWTPKQELEHIEDFGEPIRPPEPPPFLMTLVLVLMINMPDAAALTRCYWLDSRRAYYSWMPLEAVSRIREAAVQPEQEWARMTN